MHVAKNALPENLHDTVLKNMRIDFASRCVTLDIEYYATENNPKRTCGSLVFEEVELFSQASGLLELSGHAFAGHISYMRHDKESYFIYLAAGCIAIKARQAYIANSEH